MLKTRTDFKMNSPTTKEQPFRLILLKQLSLGSFSLTRLEIKINWFLYITHKEYKLFQMLKIVLIRPKLTYLIRGALQFRDYFVLRNYSYLSYLLPVSCLSFSSACDHPKFLRFSSRSSTYSLLGLPCSILSRGYFIFSHALLSFIHLSGSQHPSLRGNACNTTFTLICLPA